MILPLIDRKIREAFSNSAIQYEVLANLQKEIGRELVNKFNQDKEYKYILDVGMGPGWLTNRLKNYFPDACVVGIDFASGMTERAVNKYEDIRVVQADASVLPFQDNHFDIITSNLAYQWVSELDRAFRSSHDALKSKGTFCITMFGYDTLKELFASLDESSGTKDVIIKRLVDRKSAEESLKSAGFQSVEVQSEYIKSHFANMLDLIRWLKSIGANVLEKNKFIGKELLRKADEVYERKYKDRFGVYATFEVLWIKAQKS